MHAHENYNISKQSSIQADETDTVVIKKTIGSPTRALKSAYTLDIMEREKAGAGYEELQTVINDKANCEFIYEGHEENGFGLAGQVIGLINDIPTVHELFDEMIATTIKGFKRIDTILEKNL